MTVPPQVVDLVTPIVESQDLELYDLELAGGTLRVTVAREGGVGLDAIAATTRAVSRALDERDPIASSYTLEVSSPGVERPLRTSAHYRSAVGERVAVKLVAGVEGERRIVGVVLAADDDGVVVQVDEADDTADAGTEAGQGAEADGPAPGADVARRLPYDQIDKARTVFEWGPAPKPGKAGKAGKASNEKRAKAS